MKNLHQIHIRSLTIEIIGPYLSEDAKVTISTAKLHNICCSYRNIKLGILNHQFLYIV